MALAFFDMDGTLINADSNELFFKFMLDKGIVTQSFIEPMDEFQRLYFEGSLKIEDFVLYAIRPMLTFSKDERDALIEEFLLDRLLPTVKKGAYAAIDRHRSHGDTLLIVSATVTYIVGALGRALHFDDVIAAPVRYAEDGRVLPELTDVVPYQRHKVTRIEKYLKEHHATLDGACAYGDSINDLEMLKLCPHRYGIDATPELRARAPADTRFESWI